MNASREPRLDEPRMRRSTKVALVLLGTAGVVGAGTLVDAWWKARQADTLAPAPSPSLPLATTQTYANNDFIPGVGYYHAPYHGWFPFPFNHHDPARGYYGGGFWQAAPFMLSMLQSRPSDNAVAAALAAQRAREQADEQQRRAQSSSSGFTSNFRGVGSSSGSPLASRSAPTSSPSSGSHSIQRGGFGSSGHSSGGGAS